MSLNGFIRKYILKNKATSNIKKQQIFSSLVLSDVTKILGYEPFSSDVGIVNLNPTKGTHWVAYINENCFDRYGCAPATIYLGV